MNLNHVLVLKLSNLKFALKRGEVPRETTRELEGDLTRGSGPTHLLSSPSTAEVLKNVGEIAISPVSPPVLNLKFEYGVQPVSPSCTQFCMGHGRAKTSPQHTTEARES